MEKMTRSQRHYQHHFIPTSNNGLTLEVDKKPFYISFFWSWFLFFLPTVMLAYPTFTTHFEVDNNLLIESRGWINKTYKTVDLYRIKNISATYSPLWTGGVLTFEMQGNEKVIFDLVAKPETILAKIRQLSLDSKKEQNVSILDY